MADRWPDLFVAGPPRAATTTLYHYLEQHPDIYMSPTKEPHFFTNRRERTWRGGEPDPEHRARYLELFAPAGDRVAGDASTSTFWYPKAAERIRERVPDARFVVPLRDPVERTWSHFLRGWDRPGDHDSIAEVLDDDVDLEGTFLDPSFYGRHVGRLVDTFGEDRVLVVLLPDLNDDPRGELRRIAAFLDVDADAVDGIDLDLRANTYATGRGPIRNWIHTNRTLRRWARRFLPLSVRRWIAETLIVEPDSPDKPPLDDATRRRLQDLYREDLDELEEVLDRDVSALKRDWI